MALVERRGDAENEGGKGRMGEGAIRRCGDLSDSLVSCMRFGPSTLRPVSPGPSSPVSPSHLRPLEKMAEQL